MAKHTPNFDPTNAVIVFGGVPIYSQPVAEEPTEATDEPGDGQTVAVEAPEAAAEAQATLTLEASDTPDNSQTPAEEPPAPTPWDGKPFEAEAFKVYRLYYYDVVVAVLNDDGQSVVRNGQPVTKTERRHQLPWYLVCRHVELQRDGRKISIGELKESFLVPDLPEGHESETVICGRCKNEFRPVMTPWIDASTGELGDLRGQDYKGLGKWGERRVTPICPACRPKVDALSIAEQKARGKKGTDGGDPKPYRSMDWLSAREFCDKQNTEARKGLLTPKTPTTDSSPETDAFDRQFRVSSENARNFGGRSVAPRVQQYEPRRKRGTGFRDRE